MAFDPIARPQTRIQPQFEPMAQGGGGGLRARRLEMAALESIRTQPTAAEFNPFLMAASDPNSPMAQFNVNKFDLNRPRVEGVAGIPGFAVGFGGRLNQINQTWMA